MDRLGIESVDVLTVDDGILPDITRDFLQKLENVTELNLISNNIQNIENDAFCELPQLTHLDLTRNTLSLTPDIFDCLENLLVLEMSSNGFDELPNGVFKRLEKLKVLHLWGNHIKTLNQTIFEHLTNLTLLELSINRLEELPNGIFDTLINLKLLNLNYNKIKNVPADLFTATTNLQKIRWDGNMGLQLNENLFANLPKLENISLAANGFETLPKSLFENSTSIQNVILAKNRLQIIPMDLFYGLQNLRTLDLSHNKIERFEVNSFVSLRKLERLFLQDNKILDINAELFHGLPGLQTLRLDYNQIVTLPNLHQQKHLKFLNASHNRISFEENLLGVTPLNQCIELEELDLSHNAITSFEEDFMNILIQLRILDLSFNNIGYISVSWFQRMSQHEYKVILSNNNITFVDFSAAELQARLQDDLDIMHSNSFNTVLWISSNPLICDCNAYDLWRYYNNKLDPRVPTMVTISKENVLCASSGEMIAELPPKFFTCDLEELVPSFECPQNCSCRWIPFGKEIAYNCANSGLKILPEINLPNVKIDFDSFEVDLQHNELKNGPTEDDNGYTNVTKLLLSHNEIDQIEWVPPRLEVILKYT